MSRCPTSTPSSASKPAPNSNASTPAQNHHIYVTHDQEEAMTLGDRIVVMKDGDIHSAPRPWKSMNAPSTASSPASSARPR